MLRPTCLVLLLAIQASSSSTSNRHEDTWTEDHVAKLHRHTLIKDNKDTTPSATNHVTGKPALEQFAVWVSEKLDMSASSHTSEDSEKCKDAPKATTALILQIFLGQIGVGFGYMGRWDWFGICWACILSPCILCCVTLFCCTGNSDAGNNRYSSLDHQGEIPDGSGSDKAGMGCWAALSGLAYCMVSCASFGVWVWGIIAIANKSLDTGNGCQLSS